MNDPEPEDPHDLHQLLAQGDRACAHDDGAGLAATAHLLAMCVAPPDGLELAEIERLAGTEMTAARQQWVAVTRRVRSTLFAEPPAARSDH